MAPAACNLKIVQKDMPFLLTKGLIVVSDFVTTQTLAIYKDEGHDYYALSKFLQNGIFFACPPPQS